MNGRASLAAQPSRRRAVLKRFSALRSSPSQSTAVKATCVGRPSSARSWSRLPRTPTSVTKILVDTDATSSCSPASSRPATSRTNCSPRRIVSGCEASWRRSRPIANSSSRLTTSRQPVSCAASRRASRSPRRSATCAERRALLNAPKLPSSTRPSGCASERGLPRIPATWLGGGDLPRARDQRPSRDGQGRPDRSARTQPRSLLRSRSAVGRDPSRGARQPEAHRHLPAVRSVMTEP